MKREGECIDQSAKRIETEIPGIEVQACISDDDQTLKELGSVKNEEVMADKVNSRHQLKVWISAKHIYQKDFDKFFKLPHRNYYLLKCDILESLKIGE